MTWKISHPIREILQKGSEFEGITREDAVLLMGLDLHSRENYALMETANRMSREQFKNKGEKHFHIGLNVEPCSMNCHFCSLTHKAGIFKEKIEFSQEDIIYWALKAEKEGADALNLMTTGSYGFDRFLEIGSFLKTKVDVPLVANTRDINHKEGEQLLNAGFIGFYHAVRLGEGLVTPFKVERRIATIKVLSDVGLLWMNCVEPVGPEHSPDEIVNLMFLARDYHAVYSGVMRRVNFPGSPMEKYGMISELQMARMVAVSRLVMGNIPGAHCTHEPNALSLMAGANLFFPEVGSSPRDWIADTGKSRGKSLLDCDNLLREMHWDPDQPSNCFHKGKLSEQ